MSVTVHIRHIRQAALCMPGARRWFKDQGLDFNAFRADGLPAKVLLATGDPLAARAVAAAEKEAANGRG